MIKMTTNATMQHWFYFSIATFTKEETLTLTTGIKKKYDNLVKTDIKFNEPSLLPLDVHRTWVTRLTTADGMLNNKYTAVRWIKVAHKKWTSTSGTSCTIDGNKPDSAQTQMSHNSQSYLSFKILADIFNMWLNITMKTFFPSSR